MPPSLDSPARRFALDVVQRLRAAGHEALWAGGCVRDQLLGIPPKDYDVATSAHPNQVRELFGHRRTLAIGASFGVVTVLGPKEAGQIEVATFRSDGAYLDGRHPESVTFSTAEHDAQRRDFTINGLFFDPLEKRVIDYVGGRQDLERRIIRAIRDPFERFDEDKLRMLRAVRFAATFDFQIEPATMSAIQKLAEQIAVVSVERIAAEMRRMLVHPRRSLAMHLLKESRLLTVILPEAIAFEAQDAVNDPVTASRRWEIATAMLDQLVEPSFATALAVLLRPLCDSARPEAICRRWKLANEEIEVVCHLLKHEEIIRSAPTAAWPKLQRLLTAPHAAELLCYAATVSRVLDGNEMAVEYCRQKLAMPPEQLNPLPLLTGDDLKSLGLQPGPAFKGFLESVRDAQLSGELRTRDDALALVQRLSTGD